MPDPVCRIAVQHGPRTVDLTLPSEAPVGLLLPSIVDLVDRGAVAEGRQWRLARVGQGRLDEATSLRDNAVRDGELLLLTTAAIPAPVSVPGDPWHAMLDAADAGSTPTRVTATTACLCAAVLGATALVWAGVVTHAVGHLVTAGAIAAAAAIGAVAVQHARPDPMLCVTFSVIAVLFAAVAGFLAVPGDPSTANSLLAAAVACSTSILLLRVTRCGTICLTALATLTALTSVATACGVAWPLPVTTMGATLATLSLGALGVAARLSIAAAGLSPAMPPPDHLAEGEPAQATRAVTAHHSLTGLVIGCAAAATLGAMFVASGCAHDGRSWPKAAVFGAVVGLVMVLRTRTHIDALRRTALLTGGMAAMGASCASVVVSVPGQANWVCLLATAGGASALGGAFGATLNPLARRAVEVLEYLALAVVVPLACWVGGLYGLVRGLSLP
jgi:type VII secretion integral membrane protein EccD